MDTPFAILENILRQETGKETVLYGFRGYYSRTLVIHALIDGVKSINDMNAYVRMSFEDDMNDIYRLFTHDNIPSFCRNIGVELGENRNGALWHYEDWQTIKQRTGDEIPEPPLVHTPETAYLHCWNGWNRVFNGIKGVEGYDFPEFNLFSADATELRKYLTEFERKIPARYILKIPGLTYKLNTNIKQTFRIHSEITTGTGTMRSDKALDNFKQQSEEAARKIELLKPHHQQMETFVLEAQKAYRQASQEYFKGMRNAA